MGWRCCFLLLLSAGGSWAESWEWSGSFGWSFFRNATIFAPGGTATAGFRNRFAAGMAVTENRFKYISGEIRYTYQDGDPFVAGRGVRTNIQGQSHALHYDVLVHMRSRSARLRPFVAVGAGAKFYVVSGPEPMVQPLADIGRLAARDEAKLLVSLGGGVKWYWGEHVVVRVDFRNYLTPYPKRLLAPAPGGTGRGLIQQLTPLLGVGYVF